MLRKTGRICYELVEGSYEKLQRRGNKQKHQKIALHDTQNVDNQERSIFFTKLPAEVRDIIYEYVFSSLPRKVIILVLGLGKNQGALVAMDIRQHYWYYMLSHVYRAPKRPFLVTGESSRGLAALLRTCCRIYNEAAPLLYARAVFSFSNLADINYLTLTISPQRLDHLQSLILCWSGFSGDVLLGKLRYRNKGVQWTVWASIWDIISGMKGLKELRIQIGDRGFLDSPVRRRLISEPMMMVKGLRFFELMLPSTESGQWDFLEDPPFKIVQKFTRSA